MGKVMITRRGSIEYIQTHEILEIISRNRKLMRFDYFPWNI